MAIVGAHCPTPGEASEEAGNVIGMAGREPSPPPCRCYLDSMHLDEHLESYIYE